MCNHVLHATHSAACCCCHCHCCCCTQTKPALLPQSRIRISGAIQCNVTRSCERVASPPSSPPASNNCCCLDFFPLFFSCIAAAVHISLAASLGLIWCLFCFGFYYLFLLLLSSVFFFVVSCPTLLRFHSFFLSANAFHFLLHFECISLFLSLSLSVSATSGPRAVALRQL